VGRLSGALIILADELTTAGCKSFKEAFRVIKLIPLLFSQSCHIRDQLPSSLKSLSLVDVSIFS
jgi:hypothetical protein